MFTMFFLVKFNHRDCDCLWNPFSDFSFTT
uniref:Uncharacterized protein n=1 Tax=Escherichia coli TaxID=562 RepID=A0A6D1P590_ECOLX|nr:hypothetical protein PGJFMKIC_00098 [Escherichia coli]